jgi:FtsP/CotA-like multicopper oxidase with cupredoxin domain
LVNAANARTFNLSFADGRPINLIASDQGFLTTTVALSRFRLAPGERVEVLVDFSDGVAATLMSEPHAEAEGTMPMGGMMHDILPLPEVFTAPFPVLDFAVDPTVPATVGTLPTALTLTRRFRRQLSRASLLSTIWGC